MTTDIDSWTISVKVTHHGQGAHAPQGFVKEKEIVYNKGTNLSKPGKVLKKVIIFVHCYEYYVILTKVAQSHSHVSLTMRQCRQDQ